MEELLTQANLLWSAYGCDAVWEAFDRVDDYCTECNISLEIDGFVFEGTGTICHGEKEIHSLECTAPDGTRFTL
jgi:hypothetical protein